MVQKATKLVWKSKSTQQIPNVMVRVRLGQFPFCLWSILVLFLQFGALFSRVPPPWDLHVTSEKVKLFFTPRSPAGRVNNSSRIRGGAIHVCCRQRVSSCTAIPGPDRRALVAGPKTTTSHLTVMAEESPPGRFGVFLSVATLALLAAGSPISGEWQLRVPHSDQLPCWSRPQLSSQTASRLQHKSLNNSCGL